MSLETRTLDAEIQLYDLKTAEEVTPADDDVLLNVDGIVSRMRLSVLAALVTSAASLVTATSVDTFQNKTINLGSNTLSGTVAQFNTALSDGDFATLAGTESLSNKTIASPTISGTAAGSFTLSGVITFTQAPVFTNASGTRTALGLGTAATQNTGTSGANVPLLNGTNTWSASQTFTASPVVSTTTPAYRIEETDAGADEKRWQIVATGGGLLFQTRTDVDGAGATWANIQRTGTTVDEIELNATTFDLNGALDLSGAATLTGGFSAAAASSVSVAGTPLTLTNTTDTGGNIGLLLQSDRATPANNDQILLDFRLSDSAGNQDLFARISGIANVVTSGSESGNMSFGLMKSGVFTTLMILSGSASTLAPNSNDGCALGTTSLMWSDLFLASGAVINWNNGDVTVTHSSNTLAFAGASSGYTFDAINTISLTTSAGGQNALSLESTDVGAIGPNMRFYHNSASPVANDDLGRVAWWGRTTGTPADEIYSYISCIIDDPAEGSEDAHVAFTVIGAGSRAVSLNVYKTALGPGTSDGQALGTTSLMWSDLFLASGGVINFGASNYTITHSAGTLNFNGGVTVGSPTGGDKGVGTLNATAVYDDNTLLTDLILDLAVDGFWDKRAYAKHPLNTQLKKWWLDPKAYAEYWREHRHLPEHISWLDEEDRPGLGEQVTRLVASTEIHAVHLANHEERISRLEMKEAA